MPQNLRDRLHRIRLMSKGGEGRKPPERAEPCPDSAANSVNSINIPGWDTAGCMCLRRTLTFRTGIVFPRIMPEASPVVMPGIDGGAVCENLLFFDLETTGLSGGAGTVAFLAAFGRLVPRGRVCDLRVTQYLLLDYPGEYDFIGAVVREFSADSIVVSFNGKSFDSQILKTRCLMNGMVPPEYRHADLLHSGRRLWKHILPDCSQATIETVVLGIDRAGDTPGAMAPDIWFTFLKNGDTGPLMGICDHNCRDIAGLAAICGAMALIAEDPRAAARTIRFDFEALAVRWHELTHRQKGNWPLLHRMQPRLRETGEDLLRAAAEMGYGRAQLRYALSLLKAGQYDEGRAWLYRAADNGSLSSARVNIQALRALAIDSEHRLGDAAQAFELTARGLVLLPPDSARRNEFEYRMRRLRNKINC